MDQTELNKFGNRYAKAWSSDPESVAAFYAEGGLYSINNDAPSVGRKEIAELARGYLTEIPDMQVTMDKMVAQPHGAEFHWTVTGTSAAAGKPIRISGYEALTFGTDGLITESKDIYDAAEFERQMKYGVDG